MAKMEKPQAVERLAEIIEAADGLGSATVILASSCRSKSPGEADDARRTRALPP
jgi:hypothetical protein